MKRQETFMNYRGYLALWLCLAAVLVLSVWYYLDNPIGGRSGNSFFGYSSGILATAAIVYLMWFGIRKRSYYAHRVTLKGWLAFHVWLGLALLIVVPLHSAFDFGLNVHTLAYVVMSLVIFSGLLGAIFYNVLPEETLSNRGGGALKKRFEELASQTEEIEKLKLSQSPQILDLIKSLDIEVDPSIASTVAGKKITELDQKLAVDKLALVPDPDRNSAIKAISLIAKKRSSAVSIRKEILVRAKLKIWLYAHVPLSVALMVLVVLHIFSVFYFR